MKNDRCLYCKIILTQRWQSKYCSNQCQSEFQYSLYIKKWKAGDKSGNRGVNTINISKHLKKYLLKKYGDACFNCGWGKKHPMSGVVPLEVHHMDGNANNNLENNLRLLCPNCHALTPTFRNRNKGKGRKLRKRYFI